jgi:hypothetical protein
MEGVDEYARLFKTQQRGRLYLLSGSHARGKTFNIYVLPKGEVINNNSTPLNKDAVEVYGIIGGQPGWSETYGWLHNGPWQDDFIEMVELERIILENARVAEGEEEALRSNEEELRKINLLKDY